MIDIVFEEPDGNLLTLVLDAAPQELHRLQATATEQEVERGVDLTDHVRPERRVLTLDVVFSDTPVDGSNATHVADAWELLVDARDRALIATITTRLETYDEMVLIEASAPRTSTDGSWIKAELTFAQVRKVSTELVDAPTPRRPRGIAPEDLGSQATVGDPARRNTLRSGAVRLNDLAAGFFGG